MASTFFQDYNQNTPIVSTWLNDVNNSVYTPAGVARSSLQSAAAWVRFAVVAGVVMIQQSVNVASVVRSSTGIFVVTYQNPMMGATNSYQLAVEGAGLGYWTAETIRNVTVETVNLAGVATDFTGVSLIVFGAD